MTNKRDARSYTFWLILSGDAVHGEQLEDELFESGCDDAVLGSRDGVTFLEFEREADTLADAILSAIANVQSTGAFVVRVEPDDLVTAAEIARRIGRTRESVRLLVQGERGPGTFPPPAASLTGKSPIWRWAEVARWFADNYAEHGDLSAADASVIAGINSALELRQHFAKAGEVRALWSALGVRETPPRYDSLRRVLRRRTT